MFTPHLLILLFLASADASVGTRSSAPRWIEHEVVPHERLDAIAARYGAKRDEILRANPGMRRNGWLRAGQRLRIRARVVPPPRRRLVHAVERGETWAKIAARHGVSVNELQRWNREVPRAFRAGTPLVVYSDPRRSKARSPRSDSGGEARLTERLDHAVALQPSAHFRIRNPDRAWATASTVQVVESALASFRADSGFEGEIVVCDLSDRDGGALAPHRSHRTGHDVDIRLPRTADAIIDWDATWSLVTAFVDTGEVEYIFLEHTLQRELADAGRRAGADAETLASVLQWPEPAGTNFGVVRHEPGHTRHLHIRVKPADRVAPQDAS